MFAMDTAAAPDSLREQISALMDGQSGAETIEVLQHEEAAGIWAEYHCLGEALRASARPPAVADAAFVAAVMARVTQEVHVAHQGAMAAPEAATAPVPAAQVAVPAANDAVFRWKVLAGLAAVAAVGAFTWQWLVPGAAPEASQWAQAPVRLESVQTEHGRMVRDPQLEAFLAAHREYGGVSALQAPAGFLRSATYEVAER